MTASRLAAVGLGLALSILASRCARKTFRHAPVVVISVDTLRADHLPAYGYRAVETPSLDALRRDSILYENAYSHSPLTFPSHASLLTGLLPFRHGVRDNIGFNLTPAHPTLATLLRQEGYATGAAVSTYLLRAERGLNAGFDLYDDRLGDSPADERPGDSTAQALERWASSVSGKPLFLFLHLYEPHTPYEPPEPFKSRYPDRPYDGEIAASDAVVGRFVSYLKNKGLYDPSLLFFLSDHGEGLNDHGEDEHGVFLYREDIRVPLLVKLPRSLRAGSTIASPVGLTDVVPTVMDVLGLAVPQEVQGRSLALAGSGPLDSSRRIYSETLYPRLQMGWSDLASLTDSRNEYIEAPRPELYDLLADPAQRNDLSRLLTPAFRSMRIELQGMARPFEAPSLSSREEIARLASLGYISAKSAAPSAQSLPDPKDHVETLRKFKKLFALFYAKRDSEVVSLAREVVKDDPRNISAWRMLSKSLARLGKLSDSMREMRRGIAGAGRDAIPEELAQAYEQLASLLERSGDLSGSESALREALGRDLATEPMKRDLARLLNRSGRAAEALLILQGMTSSRDVETLDELGVSLAESGRLVEARTVFERVLQAEPANDKALLHLGMLSLRERDPAAARGWFEKALQKNPRAPGTLTSMGLALSQLQDEEGAMECWRKALAIDPAQYTALYNLAILTGRHGHTADARELLRQFVAKAPPGRYADELAQAKQLLRGAPVKPS